MRNIGDGFGIDRQLLQKLPAATSGPALLRVVDFRQ
jgi:hypothetical protein